MGKQYKLPDRGPDEEPASRNQLEYIRTLGKVAEPELAKLGKWQASALIDQLVAAKQANQPRAARPTGGGRVKAAVIVVVLAGVIGALWLLFRDPGKPIIPQFGKAAAADGRTPPASNSNIPPPAGAREAPGAPAAPPTAPDWPPPAYPASYVTTQQLELLAADGSSVLIGPGQTLVVTEAARPNVWKFRHGNRTLVGSGSRVAGKLTPLNK